MKCTACSRQYVLCYNQRIGNTCIRWRSHCVGFSSHQSWRTLQHNTGDVHCTSAWILSVSKSSEWLFVSNRIILPSALRKDNVFTSFCHSVHRAEVYISSDRQSPGQTTSQFRHPPLWDGHCSILLECILVLGKPTNQLITARQRNYGKVMFSGRVCLVILLHWTSLYSPPAPPSPDMGPPALPSSLLVTSGCHYYRLVQTCSLDIILHAPTSTDIWWSLNYVRFTSGRHA